MLMTRHQKIAKLFDEDFWVTQWRSQEKIGYIALIYPIFVFLQHKCIQYYWYQIILNIPHNSYFYLFFFLLNRCTGLYSYSTCTFAIKVILRQNLLSLLDRQFINNQLIIAISMGWIVRLIKEKIGQIRFLNCLLLYLVTAWYSLYYKRLSFAVQDDF